MELHGMDTPRFIGFVRELARLPITTANLLDRHQPDPAGNCTGCTEGGTGRPHLHWPCVLHNLASAAADHADRRHARRAA